MVQTIGYHVVKSGYGQWLPGDDRGSWSQAWEEQIGYIEPHTLHAGDPVRKRMAQERMNHPAVQFSDAMLQAIADALGRCVVQSNGGLSIAAATIEPTHMHLLIPYSGRDIHRTVKWLADQTTKAVHRHTAHAGPVWCKGKWCSFVFDESQWRNTISYIERHHTTAGRTVRSYAVIM
ncbi:MAG: transposase [Planctomycetes bacterium]|nr:transposase [Planctomycetota bacterium]